MTEQATHRLAGLEPDNLLAFLALLGMLRTLEHVRPKWYARVGWTIDSPPVRPTLAIAVAATEDEIVAAIAEGINDLARRHDFGQIKNLTLSPEEAAERLINANGSDRYTSDLWAALVNNAAVRDKGKRQEAEPTPLCLLFGQGYQHFMSRLASVPKESAPPARGVGRKKTSIDETTCLREALFKPWTRPDATFAFRWDPHEDVRYALRATDPTDSKTKEKTQHGANRLAAIGLSVLTVVPRRQRAGTIRLNVVGGQYRKRFEFTWPIWRDPISLAAVRSLLGHAKLVANRATLGVVELRRTQRISVGRFMNFTRAEPIELSDE